MVMINPMPSFEEWPLTDYDPIDPLAAKVQVGKPKKARKSAANEPKDATGIRTTSNTT